MEKQTESQDKARKAHTRAERSVFAVSDVTVQKSNMVIGKPIVGNLPDIPKIHSWLKFKEWADEYGPIFQLNIAGRKHVVLSQEKIANDLLRERGSLYSSREYLPFASGLLSNNLRPLLLPYNG